MISGDVTGQGGLLHLVPPIRRAREFRLYTEDGRRLADLWQYGGAAVLGHTPPGVLRELKNTAERGLFAPLPSRLEGRFIKALSRLFPGRVFRVYAGEHTLEGALARADYAPRRDWPDPALGAPGVPDTPPYPAHPGAPGFPHPGPLSLWRPFLHTGDQRGLAVPGDIPALMPVLPQGQAPWVLALDPSVGGRFPPSDIIAPVTLAAAARGIYDLIAAAPERGVPCFPRINRALSQGPWRRRGIYLRLGETPGVDSYTRLFQRFLEGGFLLPPGPGLPLILPGLLSPGEEAKLAGLLSFPP
jgi:hypothetical protein